MRGLFERRWALVPPLLLAITFTFAFITVRLALRDHGTAAEGDYYRKAIEWDAQKARREAGDSLRWTVSPSLSRLSGTHAALELAVADKHGVPIDGAIVAVEAIPVRAADSAIRLGLTESTPGRYHGTFSTSIPGQWEFRVDVHRGIDRVSESFRRILAPPTTSEASHE